MSNTKPERQKQARKALQNIMFFGSDPFKAYTQNANTSKRAQLA